MLLLCLLVVACSSVPEPDKEQAREPRSLMEGSWLVELDLGEEQLPFSMDLQGGKLTVKNGEEIIEVTDVSINGDSILIRMPLFDTEFQGIIKATDRFEGVWRNHLKGPDYRIPFVATHTNTTRFPVHSDPLVGVGGNWKVVFSPGVAEDEYPAIGLFERTGSEVHGTFLTETGDYRYLAGVVDGDSLKLSCFDGSHAFLFHAAQRGDSLIGRFWSGIHWQEPWVATKDPKFALRDPNSLTRLQEGYSMVDFNFPNIDGGEVSPKSFKYKDHVLLVQIMGSWCPNCVDETRMLNEFYAQYHKDGLEVIALACEAFDEPRASKHLRKWRDQLGIQYDIAYVGNIKNKGEAQKKLPFLDHIMSYPTCIVIDRKGMVKQIHTGFNGPSTGKHYTDHKRAMDAMLKDLIAEPVKLAALRR